MKTLDNPQPLDLRGTAKGIAVRAGFLSIAALIVGTWLFSLAAKAASGLVKIATGLILLAIGGGYAAWEVKKMRRHLGDHETQPALP